MKPSTKRTLMITMLTMVAMFVSLCSWAEGSIEIGTNVKDIPEKPFDQSKWSFDIYSPDSYELFEFVATKSEFVKFYTNVSSDYDPYTVLFDSQMRPIRLGIDNMDAINFNYNSIVGYRIIEGDTYYLGVRDCCGEAIPNCEIKVETTFMAYGQEVKQPETATDLDLKTLKLGYNNRTIPAITSADNWDKTDAANYELFEYVAEKSGKYSFSTVDFSHTMGVLFDSKKKVLTISQYVDSKSGNNNFILSRDVVAGTKYYVGVRDTYGRKIDKCKIAIKSCTEDYGIEYEGINNDYVEVGNNTRKIERTPFDMDKWRYDTSDIKSYNLFKFVAPASNTYNFRTEGNNYTEAVLFDANLQPLWMSHEIEGSYYNFNLSYSCTAGQTYYLGVRQSYGQAINKVNIVVEKTTQQYGEKYVDVYSKNIVMGSNKRVIDVNEESYDFNDYESYSDPQKYEMYGFVAPKSEKVAFHFEGALHAYAVLFDKDKQPVWKCTFDYQTDGSIVLDLSYDVVEGEMYYFGIHRTTGMAKYVSIDVAPCSETYGMAAVNPKDKTLKLGTNYRMIAKTYYDWGSSTALDWESPDNYDLFEFVATESGKISFSTDYAYSNTFLGILLDSKRSPLWISQYVTDEDRNMILSYDVVEGEKYYLGLRTYFGGEVDNCAIIVQPCSETYGDGVGILYKKELALGLNVRKIPDLPTRRRGSGGEDYDENTDETKLYHLFKFVAPEDGKYLFYTTGENVTEAILFDRESTPLYESNYIDGIRENDNFALSYDMQRGATYYIGIAETFGMPIDSCNIMVETTNEVFGRKYVSFYESRPPLFTMGNYSVNIEDPSEVSWFNNKKRYLVVDEEKELVKLVLEDFEYEGSELQDGAYIYCDGDYTLEIVLKGKNKITITDAKFNVEAIRADVVFVEGDGSLEINISDKVEDGLGVESDMLLCSTNGSMMAFIDEEDMDSDDLDLLEHILSLNFYGNLTINNHASLYAMGMKVNNIISGDNVIDINVTRGDSLAVGISKGVFYFADGKVTIDCKGENSLAFDCGALLAYDAELEMNAGKLYNCELEDLVLDTRATGTEYKVFAGKDKDNTEAVKDEQFETLKNSSYMHSYGVTNEYQEVALYDDERSNDFFDNLAKMKAKECIPMNVTVMRTFYENELTTLCLPFDVDDVSMFDVVAEYVGGGVNRSLKFKSTDCMKAGKPYLVLTKNTLLYPTFEHVKLYGKTKARAVKNQPEYYGIEYEGFEHSAFQGIFTPTVIEGSEYYYELLFDQIFHPIEAGYKMSGLRGYFSSPSETSWLPFTVDGIDSRYVDIDGIAVDLSSEGATFNLQGQRVKPDTKGIVIRNGKKYFIK